MQRSLLALALAGALGAASAQNIPETPAWQELEAPPPPALRTSGLLPLDMPGSSLRFGVDPASIQVGADRVVRYVVVVTNPAGGVSGLYEGLRCETAEVKVYARQNADSGWVPTHAPEWQSLRGTAANRHSMALARSGACSGRLPNVSAAQIVRDLRMGTNEKYRN